MLGPLNPLDDEDVAELRELLKQSGSVSLEYARGVFSAVACSPSAIEPTVWLPWILADAVPDKVTLRRLFDLLMRDAKSIGECLELGEPWFPLASDEVTQVCKGFVRVSQHVGAWKAHAESFLILLPFAAVAGYVELDSISRVVSDAAADPAAWLDAERPVLRQRLLELYQQLGPLRAEQQRTTGQKIGRNEPCPCGSGKKYKKCCAP